MTVQPTRWVYADPTEPGVFAVLHSWDAHEGTFPDSAQWSGTAWVWDMGSQIVAYAGPFPSQADAKAWANEHDPGY